MALPLKDIERAHKILKEYDGDNSYIIDLKNSVFAYKTLSLNDFHVDFILNNYDKEPKFINKIVKIIDWYGEKLKGKYNLEFTPKVLLIGYYMGSTTNNYVFYAKYRQSQDKAVLLFPSKNAILTDFLTPDFHDLDLDFTEIEKKCGRTLYEHQKEAVKFLIARKKAILSLDMGLGKCEPLSADIPTPNGFVKMGDIKPNDKIFGSDGQIHNVLQVYPQGVKKMYKVYFSDGTVCRCGEEHLWIVKKCKTPKDKPWKVMSLKDIMNYGVKDKTNEHANNWKIPICEPVNYKEQNHFINPYLLGILIGDGCLCHSGISISIPDYEYETVETLTKIIGDKFELHENRSASCPRYHLCEKKRHQTNPYIQEIKRLKLNVKSRYKFIPDEYKIDSINNRFELLRGLMDSDGAIAKGNKITFSTTSEQLADDIVELVYSLGGRAVKHNYAHKRKGEPTIEFTVIIQIKNNPFKLKRKAEKYCPTFVKYCAKYICKVEEDGEEEAQCIYVDSPDHSYLTGHHYIVTHNTITSIVASILGNYKHILVVCPSSVKKTWYDELKLFENEENITVVQGSEWKDAKYTVINYDILDNFYVIPKQKIKVSELNVDNEGNVFKETKEKEIVSRSKKIINEAMANSQLFLAKYDLIIIDEAHRLSNSTSGRFKIMQDLIKRSNPDGIFELTGTLITNSVSNLYNLLKLIGVPITKDWQHYMERYAGCKFFYKKNERAAYTAMFCKGVGKSDWASLSYDEKKRLDEWLDKHCKKIMIPSGEDTNLEELQEIIKPYYYKRNKEELKNMAIKTVKVLHYEMDDEEKESYNNLWESYLALQEDKEKTEANKKLIEVSLMRQWLADKMISRTISLVRKCIEAGHKVVIFCAYDNEINKFVEEFNNECVYHNGKLNEKKKAEAVEKFQNDENIKVFVGNITSAGVGLTLIAASVAVFNNFSFVPSDNHQCEDRIVRIGQTKPCTIYYQSFDGTYFDDMLKIVNDKQEVIDKVIKKETDK